MRFARLGLEIRRLRPEAGNTYISAKETVAAAKAAGGITTVASVDHSAKNILGIIGEWCTIVKGS